MFRARLKRTAHGRIKDLERISRNPRLSRRERQLAVHAPKVEMEECKQVLAAESKAKKPFAHLPKSTFILGEFKCKDSNEDTLVVVLSYFGENFDKDCWSLWYSEYCLSPEFTQTFISCNLITGMFQ